MEHVHTVPPSIVQTIMRDFQHTTYDCRDARTNGDCDYESISHGILAFALASRCPLVNARPVTLAYIQCLHVLNTCHPT